ncbi:uncharacterized protein N7518_008625 [Penicillium psychrosexuale]|uniref:uncharacterized protein n=1 Tax=Penicillium psychrosexuale TaxID=1002107 RepID=UPI002545B6CE|nr:uncharacterized protein N7518_008625 [Penicillium psychrosexuale]KAJ5791614.1 hypothetical protein N7518_008625 [Penicillium psychrosexuale]
MSFTQKQEKTSNLVKALGLTQARWNISYWDICACKSPSKVTPSSARTVFTKGRRTLEKWEERVIAGATKKAEEHERIDEDNPDEAGEAAHVEDTEN